MQTHDPKRRLFGFLALAVFAGMAILLAWRIKPFSPDGFMPQATITGYSDADLWGFVRSVDATPGALDLYTFVLAWVDPAFILFFTLWVILSLRNAAGLAAALTFALLDMAENALLLYRLAGFRTAAILNRSEGLSDPGLSDASSLLSWITAAKLALAITLVGLIIGKAAWTRSVRRPG